MVDDNVYQLEYKGLHMMCFMCGKFRHTKKGCQLVEEENFAKNNQNSSNEANVRNNNEMRVMLTTTKMSLIKMSKDSPLVMSHGCKFRHPEGEKQDQRKLRLMSPM